LCRTTGSASESTFELEAVFPASANDAEAAIGSQSKSDSSPKVNFARLVGEMDGFGIVFDWEVTIANGNDDGLGEREIGICGSGGDGNDFVGIGGSGGELGVRVESDGNDFVGRGGSGGELGKEDGVGSDGVLDGIGVSGGEFDRSDGVLEGRGGSEGEPGEENGVKGGGDGSGCGSISFNVDSVLSISSSAPNCRINLTIPSASSRQEVGILSSSWIDCGYNRICSVKIKPHVTHEKMSKGFDQVGKK
jgi:hypothetical protein